MKLKNHSFHLGLQASEAVTNNEEGNDRNRNPVSTPDHGFNGGIIRKSIVLNIFLHRLIKLMASVSHFKFFFKKKRRDFR